MFATYTTVAGRLVTAVQRHEFDNGSSRVSFRVASTERRYNRAADGWADGGTLYITVKCRRQLGDNVQKSLGVGDPVVVYGRLFSRNYERDGRRESVIEMDADAVGPDLRWATAAITRTRAAAANAPEGSGAVAAAYEQQPARSGDDRWTSPSYEGSAGHGGETGMAVGRNGNGAGGAPTEAAVGT